MSDVSGSARKRGGKTTYINIFIYVPAALDLIHFDWVHYSYYYKSVRVIEVFNLKTSNANFQQKCLWNSHKKTTRALPHTKNVTYVIWWRKSEIWGDQLIGFLFRISSCGWLENVCDVYVKFMITFWWIKLLKCHYLIDILGFLTLAYFHSNNYFEYPAKVYWNVDSGHGTVILQRNTLMYREPASPFCNFFLLQTLILFVFIHYSLFFGQAL